MTKKTTPCRLCCRMLTIPMPEGKLDTCWTDQSHTNTTNRLSKKTVIITWTGKHGEQTNGTDLYPIIETGGDCPHFELPSKQ